MNTKLHIVLVILCLFPACLVFGQSEIPVEIGAGVKPMDFEKVGTTGWQFLKLNTNARSAAMAGITTAISHGDATSVLSNPASIADIKNMDASVTKMNWIADIAYNSASVVKNMGNWGVFGLSFITLDYGTLHRTSINANTTAGVPDGTYDLSMDDGTFSGGDLALGLSYARNVTDRLQLGGTFRYITETLDDGQDIGTSNWCMDVGTVYYTGIKSLRIAMLGRNFGPDVNFTGYDEQVQIPAVDVKMPMQFVMGVGYDLLEAKDDSPHLLTLAGEFVHPNDGPEKINIGTEYTFNGLFSLRAGYRAKYDEEGLTFGAGINVHTGDFRVKINYAYLDFGTFDYVHLYTLNIGMD